MKATVAMTTVTATETATETLAACAERVAAAERAVALARERAEYHNWNGGSSRQYAAAMTELRAARRAARQAQRQRMTPTDDCAESEA